MCRIAGIYNPSSLNLRNDIITMRDSMRHGGPDDEGVYVDDDLPLALGHRRLSFLDLSAAGHQPMQDLDGNIQLVFNGEIYNYRELRSQMEGLGHIFQTQTDTEVILKTYLQYGTGCFELFNGMFALALYDKRSRQLLLARDYAGIKPLYYSLSKDALFFSSEVRGFKAIDAQWAENETWKIHLLTFGYLPEPVTTLQEVVPLQKGTFLVIDLPSLQTKQHTFCRFAFSYNIFSAAEATDVVRQELTNAVERHLLSDAPIGLFLSGGTDSSILTLLANRFVPGRLHTLSIVFEDEKFSEAQWQQLIINKTKAYHRSFLVKGKEFYESLPDILQAMDQPSTDGINSYFICKYARQYGLKAVLSGLGADELFGGYDSFYRTSQVKYLNLLPAFVLNGAELLPGDKKKKVAFLRRKDVVGEYLLHRGLFTPHQVAELLGCSVRQVNNVVGNIRFPNVAGINARERISAGDQSLYMQNQLLKDIDYMSMWHGLEVRVPFLDKEVLKTVHAIHPSVKYRAKEKKFLLINAFKDILPEEIYHRKKRGFTFPFKDWMHKVQTTNQRDQIFLKLLGKLNSGSVQWSRYWAYLLACHQLKIAYYLSYPKKVLFLNLDAFRAMGGIEKFNRAFLKALSDLGKEGKVVGSSYSAYDNHSDQQYFEEEYYRGFNARRIPFIIASVRAAYKYDTIILGHINLSLAGWLVKKIFPSKQVVLIAHGIEVWEKLNGVKGRMIHLADKILAVSHFTKNKLVEVQAVGAQKIVIFHNTIDPFFRYPINFQKPPYLIQRYGFHADTQLILTLTRLASSEKYKGYDRVMQVLPELKKRLPRLAYMLAGKPDEMEKKRISDLIAQNDLNNEVMMTGFVKDEEVTDHFLLADAFIMPSQKEGFGIVFIEAMACGLPVIAGNKDGSVDALRQGELGMLVDPDSETEILQALENTLLATANQTSFDEKKLLQQKVITSFGFDAYKKRLEEVLTSSLCPSS